MDIREVDNRYPEFAEAREPRRARRRHSGLALALAALALLSPLMGSRAQAERTVATPAPTAVVTPAPTASPTPVPAAAGASTSSPTPSPTASPTSTPAPTASPSPSASPTPSPTPVYYGPPPAPTLSVSASGFKGNYDGAVHTVTASVNHSAYIEYSTDGGLTWSSTAPTARNVDESVEVVQIRATNSAYANSPVTATAQLVVLPLPVTVTARTQTYNQAKTGAPPTPSCFISGILDGDSGLVDASDFGHVQLYNSANAPVTPSPSMATGTYTNRFVIEHEQGYHKNYYLLQTVNGSYTVANTPLSVTGTGYSGTYDGVAHPMSYSVSDASGTSIQYSLDGGATWSATVPSITNVEDNALYSSIMVRAVNGDYAASPVVDTNTYSLSLSPVAVTVTAEDKTVSSGAADPAWTAAVSGLVGSDTVSVLSYSLSCTHGVTPGDYPITVSGAATQHHGNYTVSFVPGTLTVTPALATTVSVTFHYDIYDVIHLTALPTRDTGSGDPHRFSNPGNDVGYLFTDLSPGDKLTKTEWVLEGDITHFQFGVGFNGWYTDQSFTTEWDFDHDTVDGDIELYAQWIGGFSSHGFADVNGGSATFTPGAGGGRLDMGGSLELLNYWLPWVNRTDWDKIYTDWSEYSSSSEGMVFYIDGLYIHHKDDFSQIHTGSTDFTVTSNNTVSFVFHWTDSTSFSKHDYPCRIFYNGDSGYAEARDTARPGIIYRGNIGLDSTVTYPNDYTVTVNSAYPLSVEYSPNRFPQAVLVDSPNSAYKLYIAPAGGGAFVGGGVTLDGSYVSLGHSGIEGSETLAEGTEYRYYVYDSTVNADPSPGDTSGLVDGSYPGFTSGYYTRVNNGAVLYLDDSGLPVSLELAGVAGGWSSCSYVQIFAIPIGNPANPVTGPSFSFWPLYTGYTYTVAVYDGSITDEFACPTDIPDPSESFVKAMFTVTAP